MKNINLGRHHDVLVDGNYTDLREKLDNADSEYVRISNLTSKSSYINLTGQRVIIKDRHGITFCLEPLNSSRRYTRDRQLILIKEYIVANSTYVDTSDMLRYGNGAEGNTQPALFKSSMDRLNESRKIKERQSLDQRASETHVGVTATVDLELLERGLFLPDFDIITYLETDTKTYHHPFSEDGKAILNRMSTGKDPQFSMRVSIYDKNNVIDCRWMNLNGFVTKVVIDRSGKYPCGMRAIYEGNGASTDTGLLTFAEGDERLRLFKTKEEADALGNKAEVDKREWEKRQAELELEIEQLKKLNQKTAAENKHTEHMYDRDTMEKEKEANDDKFQKEKEKREAEQKATMRKYTLEFIKILPVAIIAIIGLVNTFKKK